MKEKLKILFQIFLPLIGGALIGFLIKDSIDYSNLVQPPLSPSSIIFPIVWSILYLLIGISYYIYRKENEDFYTIFLYYLQLFINFGWSIFFFLLKWRLFSIFWILGLILFIVLLMIQLYKQMKTSFWLFLPYLLWVLFATYLNIGVYILN